MLRLAIQSKGRLSEETSEMLREIGIGLDDSHRKFLLQVPNFPLELLYMRDDDIPQVVSDGTAALGIVGLNEVVERGLPVQLVKRLGFSTCRLSLAVPKSTVYNGPDWFRGKRIATSYPRILGNWLKEKGIDAQIHGALSGKDEKTFIRKTSVLLAKNRLSLFDDINWLTPSAS